MHKICVSMLAGAAMALAMTTTASAADLYGKGGMKDFGYGPAIAFAPTWYIRGDAGYTIFSDPSMLEGKRWDYMDAAIDNSWSIGGGIGRYFGQSWRADVTVDYMFSAEARGRIGDDPVVPVPGGVRKMDIDSTLVLANVYYDFGDRNRFSPYIGVGLGLAHHATSGGTITGNCGCTGEFKGGDEWSVAAAWMAGFSIALRERFHMDAGYRGLYLGEAHATMVTPHTNDIEIRDMFAHQVRLGFRYDIR